MATSTTSLDAKLFRESGTVTVTKNWMSFDGRELEIKLACVGDDGGGTVPDTQISQTVIGSCYGNREYPAVGYTIGEVWVKVGATAPDAADITITDETGLVLYTESGIIPATASKAGTVTAGRVVTSQLTVAVTNQATADAIWDIYIRLTK